MIPLAFFLALIAPFSHALETPHGELHVTVKGRRLVATLHLGVGWVARMMGVAVGVVRESWLDARTASVLRVTLASGRLSAGGAECSWLEPSADIHGEDMALIAPAVCPLVADRLELSLPFIHSKWVPEDFHLDVVADVNGGMSRTTLRAEHDTLFLGPYGPRLGDYVRLGLAHMGLAPAEWRGPRGLHLPEGIDHLLFIAALALGGASLGRKLLALLGFTVGHLIGLALAAADLVHVSGRFADALVALSVAAVSAEILLSSRPHRGLATATLFGVVHGVGFAPILVPPDLAGTSLIEALVGFHAGIGLGQGLALLLAAPPLLFLSKKPWLRRYAIPSSEVAIFVIGAQWFAQCAFS